MSIDWSSPAPWADVLAAVGTILAVVVALVFGVREVRRLRGEQSDRADERAAQDSLRARRQAEQVTAWQRQWIQPTGITVSPEEARNPTMATRDALSTENRELLVLNTSDAAVYDVAVYFEDPTILPSRRTWVWRHAVLAPASEPVRQAVSPRPQWGGAEQVVLRVTFMDAANRYWERDDRGNLSRRADLEEYSPRKRASVAAYLDSWDTNEQQFQERAQPGNAATRE